MLLTSLKAMPKAKAGGGCENISPKGTGLKVCSPPLKQDIHQKENRKCPCPLHANQDTRHADTSRCQVPECGFLPHIHWFLSLCPKQSHGLVSRPWILWSVERDFQTQIWAGFSTFYRELALGGVILDNRRVSIIGQDRWQRLLREKEL